MARRHQFRADDPATLATRLDEILGAHGGVDAFDAGLRLVAAKLVHEVTGGPEAAFLGGPDPRLEFSDLCAAAAERWPGTVTPGDDLDAITLGRCASLLRAVRLSGAGLPVLDALFEHLATRAAKGEKGQYFTPRYVVDAIVALVGPRAGERMADPACGSGAFLSGSLAAGADAWGFDLDARAVRVARLLMGASGRPTARVQRVDSLRRGGPDSIETVAGRAAFDVILTNPPFAGDVGDQWAGVYTLASARTVERDVLFLERCVELLRPGGRLAIVLPHNKLGGAHWGYARAWLLRHARVVAVVGLGRHTFLPHTSQKADIVCAVKRRSPLLFPAGHESIGFFTPERDGKDAAGRLVRSADGRVDHDLHEAIEPVTAAFTAAVRAEA